MLTLASRGGCSSYRPRGISRLVPPVEKTPTTGGRYSLCGAAGKNIDEGVSYAE